MESAPDTLQYTRELYSSVTQPSLAVFTFLMYL